MADGPVVDAAVEFFFVQARAVDKAGNIGSATGEKQITVDLNHPRADFMDPVPIKK